jgi:uncharacterized protein
VRATPRRIVLDTNIVVSRALVPASVPGQVVSKALAECVVLASTSRIRELEEVIVRKRFDRITPRWKRKEAIRLYCLELTLCEVVDVVKDCRDPKDNMILELALSGHADLIVTGDKDLLCLHPWRGIAILSPADYLHPLGAMKQAVKTVPRSAP